MADRIQQYFDAKTTGQRKADIDYLRNITEDTRVLAYITLSITLSEVVKSNNKAPITVVANRIVRVLLATIAEKRLRTSDPKMFKYMDSEYRRASKKRKEQLMERHIANMKEQIESAQGFSHRSNTHQETRLGTMLIHEMLHSGSNVFENVLARKGNGTLHTTYLLRLTDEGMDILQMSYKEGLRRLTSTYPPMIVPPLDWTTNYDGGLLESKHTIIKAKTPAHYTILKEQPLTKIYPVINKLQRTKWRVNSRVVDVISDLMDNGIIDPRSPKKLPRLHGGLPTASPIDVASIICKADYGEYEEETGMFTDVADFVRWRRDTEQTGITLDGEKGRRLQLITTLAEAQEYMNYEEIYFCYTLDSRGRVYTSQSLLTPQSSATTKAMLDFADGIKLTDSGIKWFKIHTANVFGMDKEEFGDRLRWFDEMEATILNIARNPLGNLSDWAYCDSPFEYLAACFGWLDHTEGRVVHTPIQLDATNSGVQIYSGLLGDLEGAKTVNVVDIGYRADVYGIVAKKVNLSLAAFKYTKNFETKLSDGTSKWVSTEVEATSLQGKITRKHTKRNTMTVPYSVTRRGMSQQLWDLMDDAVLHTEEWWEGDKWVVNKLMTELNYNAIYDTIPGAKIGQDYLLALAALCNEKDGMVYTTPIYDFPVVQKKPRIKDETVITLIGVLSVTSFIPNSLDKMAQRNGSAPNFIHSMDSTLLLRVIELMSVNIGVIHDCFISHANYGDELQYNFKKAYIEIMSDKPLEALSAQLDPDGTIPVPYIGTLDLDDVWDAEYIIS